MHGRIGKRNQWSAWMRKTSSFYNKPGHQLRPGQVRQLRGITNTGMHNIFPTVEPRGRHRQATVTARRTTPDFVRFIGRLVEKVCAGAQKIYVVMDNLNTHFLSSSEEVLGGERTEQMLARVEFHYTPKHVS